VSVQGKCRSVTMPDYTPDFLDMMEPAYIQFGKSGGEFAFCGVTGSIHGTCDGQAVEFTWSGCDEMDEAFGGGWANIQDGGALDGQICFHNGDEADFIARRW